MVCVGVSGCVRSSVVVRVRVMVRVMVVVGAMVRARARVRVRAGLGPGQFFQCRFNFRPLRLRGGVQWPKFGPLTS